MCVTSLDLKVYSKYLRTKAVYGKGSLLEMKSRDEVKIVCNNFFFLILQQIMDSSTQTSNSYLKCRFLYKY